MSYYVPESWKKVQIPFLHDAKQELNGPEARHLRIDFLKKELLELGSSLPVTIFYPLANSNLVNPETHPLVAGEGLELRHDIVVVAKPLLVSNVSRLFLDIVKQKLEYIVIADTKDASKPLEYVLECVDWQRMEDVYVELFKELPQKEAYFRDRFRIYLQNMELYVAKDTPFILEPFMHSNSIHVSSKQP